MISTSGDVEALGRAGVPATDGGISFGLAPDDPAKEGGALRIGCLTHVLPLESDVTVPVLPRLLVP